MMKDLLVCILTSQNTWKNLSQYALNLHTLNYIENFDLCFVLNGKSDEATQYLNYFKPLFLFQRENVGRDLGAFAYAIKNIPDYQYTLIMHDDHWFWDSNWYSGFEELKKTNFDIIGNIAYKADFPSYSSEAFDSVLKYYGYHDYKYEDFDYFLQGMAGFYTKKAINTIRNLGGIPDYDLNDAIIGQVFERLVSMMFLKHNLVINQIPREYLSLCHKEFISNWGKVQDIGNNIEEK